MSELEDEIIMLSYYDDQEVQIKTMFPFYNVHMNNMNLSHK